MSAAVMLAGVLLGGMAGIAPASAVMPGTDVSDFSFDSFDARYDLSRDDEGRARLDVVETIVARFPDFDQNRGIVRELARFYDGVPLHPRVTSITDADGRDVPWEEETTGDYLQLALGTDEYVYGVQTYVISYQLQDVVRNFADSGGDEFYWDVNGTESAQEFGKVTATVTVADDVRASLTGNVRCYVGGYESPDECGITVDDEGTATTEGTPVDPHETVTVAIGFDGGTFAQPEPPAENPIVTVVPYVLAGLSLVLFALAIFLRVTRLSSARGRGIVVPQYSVPRDLDPLLAGVIVGRQAPSMPAQFLSLAVNRLVTVIDRSPESGADDGKYDLEFVTTEGATPRERAVLAALFGDKPEQGETVSVDELPQATSARLFALFAVAAREASRRGLRRKPSAVPWVLVGLAHLGVIAGHFATFIWAEDSGVVSLVLVIAAVASFLLAVGSWTLLVPVARLTRQGAELKEYLLGVRDYLELAEKERFRVLQSPEGALRVDAHDSGAVLKLHEKLLPFAVLWGVEREWAKQLEVEYEAAQTQPQWSNRRGAAGLGGFVGGFAVTSSGSARAPVSTSTWTSGGSSSSFSGSSGGGFAGGGGGGGGVGGR